MPLNLSPTRRNAVFSLALGLALIFALYGYLMQSARQTATESAQIRSRLMSQAFAEHVQTTVRLVDLSALNLARAWVRGPKEFQAQVEQTRKDISDISLQIGVADANAMVVYSDVAPITTQVSLADREHIRVHLGNDTNHLFISRPVMGRVSKKWSIQFTRPIQKDGKTIGVMVVSVDPQYFNRFAAGLELQPGDLVSIIRSSGELMVRVPGDQSYLGQSITSAPYLEANAPPFGTFSRAAQTDGVVRQYGYYRLPQFGLTVTAAFAEENFLKPYFTQRKYALVSAGGLSLILLLVITLLVKQLEAREKKATELRQTNLALEARVSERTAELTESLHEIELINEFNGKMLMTSPAVLYVCSIPDLATIYISPNVQDRLGWSSEEFTADPHFWRDHIHSDDRQKHDQFFVAMNEQAQASRRYRFLHRNGHYVWMNEQARVVRNPDGRAMEIVGSFWEVTDQVLLETQLSESQKLEAIGQLTGGLAHDFNNLLGIVVGNLDLIGEQLPKQENLLQQHKTALDAALRGAEVTRSLLAVARRQPLHVDEHDLNLLVGEMLPLLISSAGSDIAVVSDLVPGNLVGRLDAGGLSSVLLNLVINARDAMQNSNRERILTLRTRRKKLHADNPENLSPGWYALVEVADTGNGMSAAIRAQAFEPFFTTKERGRGTGLGLSMVYGYAEQLGGTCKIASSENIGTTVSLYLPMDEQTAEALEKDESARLEALRALAILDTPPEPELDAIVAAAADLCEAPIALISLVDEQRQWFKARFGLAAAETPRESAFCAHTILDPASTMMVEDARLDPRFSGNPLVTGEPGIRFYAGVPLRDADNRALGTLCVVDLRARTLTAMQQQQLQAMAGRVTALLLKRPDDGMAQPAASLTGSRGDPVAPRLLQKAPVAARALKKKVLVVDDEQDLCVLACAWLESLGYETQSTNSPKDALKRMTDERFDILFSDVVMPGGMDGLALAREAKKLRPAIGVLLTSGYAQSLLDAPDLPGHLLNKPYRKGDLGRAFDELAKTAPMESQH